MSDSSDSNPEHVFAILDEIHDEYDASEYDERSASRDVLVETLKQVHWQAVIASMESNPASHRQLLIELASAAVAIVVSIDKEQRDEEEGDD